MPQCAMCGKEVPRRTAVFKVMQTGKYASGDAFMREVNLCPRSAEEQEKLEKTKKRQKVLVVLVLVLAAVGGAVWWFFFRPQ